MSTLGEFAALQAQRYGEKPLFFSREDIVSYRAFHDRTDRLAGALAALGIGKGDRIAILLGNGLEIVEIYMAAAKCGAVSIPLNTMFTAREIAYVVNNSRASILMTTSEHIGRMEALRSSAPSLKHIVAIGERVVGALCWEDVVASGCRSPPVEVAGGDVAMTLYTSGTTGHPKGAMLTHEGLLHNARAVVEAVGFRDSDRSLCMLPLFHLFAIAFDYLQMMTAGASTVIVGRFEAGEALELIERHRVTILVGVPTMFIYLLDHPDRRKRDLSSLRIGDTGGGPVPQSLKAAWKHEVGMTLIESYGLTEASPVVSIERPETPRREGSCGLPLPGMETRVVNHDNQDVPCGEPGELLVRGANVMRGYFEMPEATAQTVVDGWLHTGDLVRMDRDGYLYMIDRIKHMIICGGYNIYPKEVENILHAHPEVLECAVIGVPDLVKGEIPKACVVLRRGAHTTEQEIKDYCREALAAYKVPRVVEFMESLPKTATGKIRKVELVGGANSLAPK
jgi:acyl-CoA synthetase (AMP-forming)/AMP-acid ligase II